MLKDLPDPQSAFYDSLSPEYAQSRAQSEAENECSKFKILTSMLKVKSLKYNILYLLLILFVAPLYACNRLDEFDVGSYLDIEPIAIPEDEIAFLHISDVHSSDRSLDPACDFLNLTDCSFGLLSGDIIATPFMKNKLLECKKPFLMIPGNHDAYDNGGEYNFRTEMLDPMQGINNVVFGSEKGNFWHRDFHKSGYSLRVIGIDQWQIDHYSKSERVAATILTQEQIDWFIQILKDSYDFDGIIIMIHEGFGNAHIGQRDINHTNDFISIYAKDYHNSYDYAGIQNALLIPDIVEAYLSGENINGKGYVNANEADVITVTTDFDGAHDNFIAYFGGHTHWDIVEHLNDYPRQLLSLVAYGGYRTGSPYNDLVKSPNGVNSFTINLNLIDFKNRKITIKRLGSKTKVDGTLRESISFNF